MWLQPLEEEPVEMEEEIEMVEWATEMLEETTGVTEGETETQGTYSASKTLNVLGFYFKNSRS